MEITSNDLCHFNKFLLKWRFTDPNYNVLPMSDRSKIKPLNELMAQKVFALSRDFVEPNDNNFSPNQKLFEKYQEIHTEDIDKNKIKTWLNKVLPMDSIDIVISWEPKIAVLTERQIFIQYWDDFCYPSSDDVRVFPTTEEWILLYWHEECFYLAHRKTL